MSSIASQNLEQVDRKVLHAFQAGALQYSSKYQDIFVVEVPTRVDERYTIVKMDSTVDEVTDGGAFPESTIKELGANVISQKVFKAAVAISDLSENFDNYGAIEKAAMRKAFQAKYKIDQVAALFLNNATSSTAPYGINIAGTTAALVTSTNTVGDTGVTYSNKVTGNLNKTNLNTAYIQMSNMPTHENIIAGHQAKRLVVPTNEHLNAWQITRSNEEPESANRNKNFTNTLGLQLIVWPLLTNTTGCFLLADKSENGARGLRMVIKENPTVRRILSQTTGNWVYQLRMILNAGVTDWQGVVSMGL